MIDNFGVFWGSCFGAQTQIPPLTIWEIDPSVVEDAPVTVLDVLEAVDDVGVDGGLNFESAGTSFRLK